MSTADVPDDDYFALVADEILQGLVIPFLGAGVNLYDRDDEIPWTPGAGLPSGRDLAAYLAEKRKYPEEESKELVRVSQYVKAVLGSGVLYADLRAVFTAQYEPNEAHRLLARLPRALRASGSRQLLAITTNYDDALESAYEAEGEEYDVVYYEARPKGRVGKFFHRRSGSTTAELIEVPNEYAELDPDERPVILKIHGCVDRDNPSRDSFVITEDDYIEYLTRNEMSSLAALKARMNDSHYLFLGYSLQDWNLRVILNEIWGDRDLDMTSWAVQKPDQRRSDRSLQVEKKLWDDRGEVDLRFVDLMDYIRRLREHIPDPKGQPEPPEWELTGASR